MFFLCSINPVQTPSMGDLVKPRQTPLEFALDTQRAFRSIGVFCHGFLAGLAFWQLVMVSFL